MKILIIPLISFSLLISEIKEYTNARLLDYNQSEAVMKVEHPKDFFPGFHFLIENHKEMRYASDWKETEIGLYVSINARGEYYTVGYRKEDGAILIINHKQ